MRLGELERRRLRVAPFRSKHPEEQFECVVRCVSEGDATAVLEVCRVDKPGAAWGQELWLTLEGVEADGVDSAALV